MLVDTYRFARILFVEMKFPYGGLETMTADTAEATANECA